MTTDLDMTDHYRALQVDPCAEFAVIRAAYRVLAALHHPDIGGSQGDMVVLNVAWTILSDPAKRAAYDHQRRLHQDGGRYTPASVSMPGPAPTASATGSVPAASSARRYGTIIDFGRYDGWSIPEIAQSDPDYLEWLIRTPNGRRYRDEILDVLGRSEREAATAGAGQGSRTRRH
jgi:curved DNA-binding protein CbpA